MAPKQKKHEAPRARRPPAMQREVREIEALESRIQAGAPRSGSNPLAESLPTDIPVDPVTKCKPYVGAKLFEQLPVSEKTLSALRNAKYVQMTDIQRAAIPHALCGRDVLGAAKTGSGKTLAFLIPVVEQLYRMRWGSMDGIGALIISPTRELAAQIFGELRKLIKHHTFQIGLLIGGKNVADEKEVVNGCNILVCTPGRLLQHMDETVNFDCSQLQALVLDEADRILDLGFAQTLDNIVSQLPKNRRTFLFSATQTRSVQDLARLSLQDPEYLAVHAESKVATPARLQQAAAIVPLEEKFDFLWSFIKRNVRSKVLVFLSSCKQVKFVYEAFRRMRPGVPVACLHGRQSQAKRMAVFCTFSQTRRSVLFATDIAARGLDFPAVDWVVQADCPEDVETYIHRAGRTARHTSSGQSLLMLCPSEKKMLELLKESKIPVQLLKAKPSMMESKSKELAAELSKDSDLKCLAQRAFVTYLRSIHLQSNKEVFDVQQLPIAEFAASIGLPSTPRVRFLKKGQSKQKKNISYAMMEELGEDEKAAGDGEPDTNANSEDDADDNIFIQKKRPRDEVDPNLQDIKVAKPKKKRLKIDPARTAGQRLLFDEEGNALPPLAALAKRTDKDLAEGVSEDIASIAEARYKKLQEEMKKRDKEDRLLDKERLRNKRQQSKDRSRALVMESEDPSEGEEASGDDDVSGNSSSEEDDEMEDAEQEFEVDKLSLAQQEALAAKLLKSRG